MPDIKEHIAYLSQEIGARPAGTEEEQQALASILLNDDCIILVPQRNGKVRQFGDDAFHVSVTPSATTGASVTDEANTTLEISVACDTMPPFYYGDIVTEEGTFSGETCKLKTAVAAGESR